MSDHHDAAHVALAGHRHPHPPSDPSGHPRIGFIGAGRVGTALGVAFSRAGWPVAAISSRNVQRRDQFTARVPGATPFGRPAQLLDEVDLIFVTVPDDAIASVAAGLRLYADQGIVHTSGALPASVLAAAQGAGSTAASFHPLVAFADLDRAVAALDGATIALEGDERLLSILADLATDLGAQPVRLPPGSKSAYHAAAVLSAGGLIGLLDGIGEVARGAGLDEGDALAIYLPLMRQALDNAEVLGIQAALTGPLLRGDVSTVRDHLDALGRLAPDVVELYRAVAHREIALAERRGELSEGRAAALRQLLSEPAPAS